MVLDPSLPATWLSPASTDPEFPTFVSPPTGGVTAWYTKRLTALAEDREQSFSPTLDEAALLSTRSRHPEPLRPWTQTSKSSAAMGPFDLKRPLTVAPCAASAADIFSSVLPIAMA